MMYQSKKCIFKYDTQDNLVEYVERDDQGKIKYAYDFRDNVLKKVYYNHKDDLEIYKEMKAVIEYPPGCIMHHTIFDGMSRVVVRKPNGDYVPPVKRMEKHDGKYTGYSVKKELISKWIKTK